MEYRVRLRASMDHIGEADKIKAKLLTEKSEFSFKEQIGGKTFRSETNIWCEVILPFVPYVGLYLSDFPKDFDWDDDSCPIISNVQYFMESKIFLVDIDWGMYSEIELLRRIEKRMPKTTQPI